MGLSIGIALFVAGVFGFWMARPRGGQVVKFLRNDSIQAYYVVAVLGAVAVGALNIVLALISLLT